MPAHLMALAAFFAVTAATPQSALGAWTATSPPPPAQAPPPAQQPPPETWERADEPTTAVAGIARAGENAFYVSHQGPLAPSFLVPIPRQHVRVQGWLAERLLQARDAARDPVRDMRVSEGAPPAAAPARQRTHAESVVLQGRTRLEIALSLALKADVERSRASMLASFPAADESAAVVALRNIVRPAADAWTAHIYQLLFDAEPDPRIITRLLGRVRLRANALQGPVAPAPDTGAWSISDEIASALWLYNRGEGKWLLDFARALHAHAGTRAPETPADRARAFRAAAEFAPVERNPGLLEAPEIAYRALPFEAIHADLDATNELLRSCLRMLVLTGEGVWADRAETLALDVLPPLHERAFDATRLAALDHSVFVTGEAAGFAALAGSLLSATLDEGLAVNFFVPFDATVTVGRGQEVRVRLEADGPRPRVVTIRVDPPVRTRFSLALRVPAAASVTARLNGAPLALPEADKGFVSILHTWAPGGTIELTLDPVEDAAAAAPAR